MTNTLAPYYQRTKASLGLPEDQRSVWQIDCWSVHRSDEFMDWMGENHEDIIVDFVPARLTGLFQPCDVGFQRVLKHSTRNSAHEDVVQEVLKKLEQGESVQSIAVDAKMKILRNRTVGWLWKAYTQLNKPKIIKKVSNVPIFQGLKARSDRLYRHGKCVELVNSISPMRVSQAQRHAKSCVTFLKPIQNFLLN